MMVHWTLRRTSYGYVGKILIEINPGAVEGGGHIAAVAHTEGPATGKTRAHAVAKTAIVAERVVEQLEANPITAALLPPGTGLALAGIKAIAKGGALGQAQDAVNQIGGSAAMRKLASIF